MREDFLWIACLLLLQPALQETALPTVPNIYVGRTTGGISYFSSDLKEKLAEATDAAKKGENKTESPAGSGRNPGVPDNTTWEMAPCDYGYMKEKVRTIVTNMARTGMLNSTADMADMYRYVNSKYEHRGLNTQLAYKFVTSDRSKAHQDGMTKAITEVLHELHDSAKKKAKGEKV